MADGWSSKELINKASSGEVSNQSQSRDSTLGEKYNSTTQAVDRSLTCEKSAHETQVYLPASEPWVRLRDLLSVQIRQFS